MANLREATVKWIPNSTQPTTGQLLTVTRTDLEDQLPLNLDLAPTVDQQAVELVELATYDFKVFAKLGDRVSQPATKLNFLVPAFEVDAPSGLVIELGGPVAPVVPPDDVTVEVLGPAS